MTAGERMRIAALDTGLLAEYCGDTISRDATRRVRAKAFAKSLYAQNTVPLLAWHQVEELLGHGNLNLARRRLDILCSLPALAWIRPNDGLDGPPGSIVDTLVREVRVAHSQPELSCQQVRDVVMRDLVKLGSGHESLGGLAEGPWELLRGHFDQRKRRNQEIVAISRAKHVDISKELAISLITGTRRSREDATCVLAELCHKLAADIRTRGDERIESPGHVASEFFQEVELEADLLTDPEGYLDHLRINPAEIHATLTMGELMDMAAFRKRLSIVNATLRLPWSELIERVKANRLPSILIEDALRLHGQKLDRHPGSELTDSHLATFVAYADFNFVDKRTAENLRRAVQKIPNLANLLNHAEKGGLYFKVPERIKKLGGSTGPDFWRESRRQAC